MKNKVFIFIVTALILVLSVCSPLIAIFSKMGYLDALHTKNLFVVEDYVKDDEFAAPLINTFKDINTALKNVYINCLPFYGEIVENFQVGKNALTRYSDQLLRPIFAGTSQTPGDGNEGEGENESIYDIDDFYALYLLGNGRPNYYDVRPIMTVERAEVAPADTLTADATKNAEYLSKLAEHYPDINIYVYSGSSFQDYAHFGEITDGAAPSTLPYVQLYQSIVEKNENVWFDYLHLDKIEDRMKLLYKTDHHWTPYGAYTAYQSIMTAIHEKTPEVAGPRDIEIHQVPGIQWIGLTGGSCNMYYQEYADNFYVFDLSWMTNFTSSYADQNDYDIVAKTQAYLEGDYPEAHFTKYFDFYGDLYKNETSITFHDNKTGRNLLIIGDSFSKCLQLILASHFDNTYVMANPWSTTDNVDFYIDEYIEDLGTTDIIVVSYSPRLIFGYDGSYFDNFAYRD